MTGTVRVGLLGCGNVGAAVVRMLHEHGEEIERRSGRRIEVARVAVRNPSKDRRVPCPAERFTADPHDVVGDPAIDIIVEVIGGIEPARSLLLGAFENGKPVVTANKELLAGHGKELFEAASRAGVDLLYEAAVGGGIPLIRPLREHLAGDRILRFLGIVNGTTNYILTRMTEQGVTLEEGIAEAQALGYAEADPGADVDGFDAAAKAAILATIAFDIPVSAGDVYREGMRAVGAEDIRAAHRLGYVVKLLAIGESDGGEVAVRVHPAMIPADHPLASVRESFNAVFIEGHRVGPLMLYGRGAGGDPTATSVVGDVIELARGGLVRASGATPHPFGLPSGRGRRLRPIEELETQYYLLLQVMDRPGVLAAIAGAFADHRVSIKSVWQEGRGQEALIVMVTHRAVERDLQATVRDLRALDVVRDVRSVLRVEAGEP